MKAGGGTLVRLTLSGGALVASIAAACCFLAVWSYWYYELDADCVQARDCKCLLFGTSFAGGGFVGGDLFACQYVAYSLMASAGLAAYTSVYYGCRLLLCAGHGRGRHQHHRPVRPVAESRPEDGTRLGPTAVRLSRKIIEARDSIEEIIRFPGKIIILTLTIGHGLHAVTPL
ncbi:uncharacterized protein LOC100573900 isoform X2 [Acyrthosiphon pisum]|uniref:Uncharacterized protein n=1 Tax=Acyrthosiphon pisum TaxID=7029 RepID=A0A8R2H8F6_ACYPI|nr:uncharacterized protein LOC100573900 isoform X2 [Acyrthosiphon pisum]|eukprot:XP_016660362.1 PREDICTED: uncharacterized protein LOC100573900 isoform X2 [Acyrthosiphon pisum]